MTTDPRLAPLAAALRKYDRRRLGDPEGCLAIREWDLPAILAALDGAGWRLTARDKTSPNERTIATLRAENERLQESFVRQRDCDHSPCIDEADALRAALELVVAETWWRNWGTGANAALDAARAALATAKEAGNG